MNCAEIEILICDYVDGALTASERAVVERHLAECPACAELARDSAAAVEFIGRAAEVEPPPELITRILFDAPWAGRKANVGKGLGQRLGALLSPILQPRFAMGMAMTILSFSMLARFVTPTRQLRPGDLEPARVLAAIEDKGYRAWARTVKFYDNLKFVYQIQTTLREWQQQQDEEQASAPEAEGSSAQTDEKRLPVSRVPKPETPGPTR